VNRIPALTARLAARGWVIGAFVYFVAFLNRSSLSVAGLIAEQRFGITPGQLSVFILLQVGVYAAMQVPTGVLVDRYGPKRVLMAAAALMAVGQLLFAIAPSYPTALLARGLLGCGDALTFISTLRYAADHFSPKRYPFLAAVTGTVGMTGSLLATLPLALLLDSAGWTPAYLVASALGLIALATTWLFMSDPTPAPARVDGLRQLRDGIGSINARVRTSWALPGTRMGFWLHFSTPAMTNAFALLWGDPYLQKSVGLSKTASGAVLMVSVIISAIAGPMLGWLIGHRPPTRAPIALAVAAVLPLGWLGAFVMGEHPPTAYIAGLFVLMAVGGPISMFAFAVARDYNHSRIVGTASGVVNVAGFVATILMAVGMGWVMDGLGGIDAHALRWALLVAIVVQLFGVFRLVVWYRRVRAYVLAEQEAGNPVPVPAVRHRWDLAPTD
jgi:MFS family permease